MQRAGQDRIQVGQARIGEPHRWRLEMCPTPIEGRLTDQHLVKDGTGGVNVRPLIDPLPSPAFGAHVAIGADDGAGRGVHHRSLDGSCHQTGETEVEDLHDRLSVHAGGPIQEQIVWLDVPMHDALGVGGSQTGERLTSDAEGFVEGKSPAPPELDRHRAPLQKLEDQARRSTGSQPEVDHLHDVRVPKPSQGTRLELEALEQPCHPKMSVHQLESKAPTQKAMLDHEHFAHAASPQPTHQSVGGGGEKLRHFLGTRLWNLSNHHTHLLYRTPDWAVAPAHLRKLPVPAWLWTAPQAFVPLRSRIAKASALGHRAPMSGVPSPAGEHGASGDLLAGTPYRAIRPLGRGDSGEVLLAEHRELRFPCVVKLLQPELASDARQADRLRLEAQALGRLRHPHIVAVKGAGTATDGRTFIVLEQLEGRTLQEELQRRGGRLPVLEALTFADHILSALAGAHRIGIVHRNLTPENIFVCRTAEGRPWLKLLDFGLARVLPDAPENAPRPLLHPTEEGVVLGTARFVSPEAARGLPVDERADIYAATLVLYQMLTGRGPFDHVARSELLDAHAAENPEAPSRHALERVTPELDRVVLRGLSKEPSQRYPSAQDFREALQKLAATLPSPQDGLTTTALDEDAARAPQAPEPHARRKTNTKATTLRPGRLALVFAGAALLAALIALALRALLSRPGSTPGLG